MYQIERTIRTAKQSRSGFTLTEMLVATALVVLIMLMFAQIYGSAVGSITEQRALANNDQKARTLETILRSDLQSMTYRQPQFPYGDVEGIVPLAPGDESIVDPANQRGYFYLSDNNWDDPTDDVLQFTVMLRAGQRGDAVNRNQRRHFTGKATGLSVANQPLADDGNTSNSQGASRAAEVSYFLRNGNLHRRVLLLRDPIPASVKRSSQPGASNGAAKYNSNSANRNYTDGSGEFLRDFDYSATRFFDPGTSATYLWFNSVESLSNHLGQRNNPIALPWNRFGHYNNSTVSAEHGLPREFIEEVPDTSADKFLGRFTMQETAHSGYNYPGEFSNVNRRSVDLTFEENRVVNGLHDETFRVAEDIVLTRVTEFNVEVFDPTADTNDDGIQGPAGFVDLGHDLENDNLTTLQNDQLRPIFGQAQRDNTTYGPRTGGNRVFDTWHTSIGSLMSNAGPPFRPLQSEIEYRIGNQDVRVFSDWAALPNDPRPTGNSTRTILFPTGHNRSFGFEFRGGMNPGSKEPEWPRTPGAIVQDGGITWECIDNRIGLRAIRITIRYIDQRSNIPRQVSLVHSFVE